jgi:hypothetical protein
MDDPSSGGTAIVLIDCAPADQHRLARAIASFVAGMGGDMPAALHGGRSTVISAQLPRSAAAQLESSLLLSGGALCARSVEALVVMITHPMEGT